MRKLKIKLIKYLYKFLLKLQKSFNEEEHEIRLQQIRVFFHEILPNIDEKWKDKAIIEGGSFNYFSLPNGKLPKFDFVLPEIPLYVVIGDIRSASWPEASLRGITREQWEEYQFELNSIESSTPILATIGMAASPKLIVIRWDDPINHFSIAEKLQDIST